MCQRLKVGYTVLFACFHVWIRERWPLLSVPFSEQQCVTLFTDPEMDHTHQIYSFE